MSFDENELRQMGFTLDRHGDWSLETGPKKIEIDRDGHVAVIYDESPDYYQFIVFHNVKTTEDLRELIRLLGDP